MLKIVLSEEFDLRAALADLLRGTDENIERLRGAAPGWEEFTKVQTIISAKYEAREPLLFRLAGRFGRVGDEELPDLQTRVKNLTEEITQLETDAERLWKSFDVARAEIALMVKDLDKVLKRLPVSAEWRDFRAAIEEIGIVPWGWAPGPPQPIEEKLITLRLRLRDMISFSGLSKRKRWVQPGTQIQLPADTQWTDIEIRFLSDHEFQVFVRGRAGAVLSFEAAGFGDRRGGASLKPNSAWATLNHLASHHGTIVRSSSARNGQKLEKNVATVRKTLKGLLGLDDDPFHPCRAGEYRAKFAVWPIASRDGSLAENSPEKSPTKRKF